MRREFLIGTTLVALVAATVTGVIADKIIEDLENHFSAGGLRSVDARSPGPPG
jgi:hypothetical protein